MYQYHLLQLRKDGYIAKDGVFYYLTGRGLAYADRHSTTLKKTRSQPKLITVIFITNNRGEVLLVPRTRQPFMGMYNLPSGKIHLDETINAAAAREIHEKVDKEISGITLEHIGTAHITISQADFTISDYVALLISAQAEPRALPEGARFVDSLAPECSPLMPSVIELLEAYRAKRPFSEHAVRIDSE